MKISTLAAAALVGGLIGFTAPNAQAFPQANQQLNVEQTATVTEVGFKKYKKRYRKFQHRRRYRDDYRRGRRSHFRDNRSHYRRDRHSFHRDHSYQDDYRRDYGRKYYRGKVSKGGFTVYF